MKRTLIVLAIAGSAVLTPAAATAQMFITPFAGVTTGGDANEKLVYGGSLLFVDDVGFELDFGYAPDFFNTSDEIDLVSDSNVTTLMGSIVVAPGDGPVRPYGQVGAGLLRTRAESFDDFFGDIDTNQFGMTAGFGLIGTVNDAIGLRGDVRYLRSFQDNDPDSGDLDLGIGTFDFWRVTAGITFQLGG